MILNNFNPFNFYNLNPFNIN